MDVKVSKKTLADRLIDRALSMLAEKAPKTVHKGKEGDQWNKKK